MVAMLVAIVVSYTYGLPTESNNYVLADSKQDDKSNTSSNTHAYTLAELLEGAKNNYTLEAKDIAILQAKATSMAAKSELLPTLDGSYQYQDVNNTFMKLNGQTISGKANWEIFSGLKTYNKIREKSALHNASIEDRENTKDQLYLSIIEQYFTFFTNQAKLNSLDYKKIQLESNIKRVEKLYSVGLTTIDDVESLRSEALITEHEIENMKLEIEKNKLMLSLLSNSDVEQLERTKIKTPLLQLNENRHDLNMIYAQAMGAKYLARQTTYLPTIAISDTYSMNSGFDKGLQFKNTGGAMPAIPGFDTSSLILRSYPANQNVIMITATLHLDALTTYKYYEAARLAHLKSLKELAYKKEEQKKDEKLYKKGLEIAVAKIKASEAALKSANIAFDNVSKKYDAQILNFTDYLQSLTKKFEAEATYNQSLNDYEKQKAYYIYYSGQSLQDHIE